jgi:Raf kinase inhibitor-like YbhB/YbcL family protein
MTLQLTSPAFSAGGIIPSRHTCDGDDQAPELVWSGAPDDTRSFALILDDPDSPDPAKPQRTYVHWVLYNIPADLSGVPPGVTADTLPAGACEGLNDWKRLGYGGPCPRIGRHRYVFTLYALDTILSGLQTPTKAELLAAMQEHILAHAELIGTYQRPAGQP